ncbi:hypothetical protein LHEJCM1005_17940 [Lactobacillus helveticus]|uniref:hypothetical protein n=1 Tax=Lactobacillus helveticus TaxID=1587 RepID=UPI00191B9C88|nr:hypothetical protein [Lactobacillus helveticus]GFP07502.1 hypothetical protein LHEJCM1005_17940 [Lactobacillus helveticus]
MLSLILAILLIWLFFKLGIGLIIFFLITAGLIFVFFAYLLVPFLVLLLIGGLAWAVIR